MNEQLEIKIKKEIFNTLQKCFGNNTESEGRYKEILLESTEKLFNTIYRFVK